MNNVLAAQYCWNKEDWVILDNYKVLIDDHLALDVQLLHLLL